jgi:transposase InsO family protein
MSNEFQDLLQSKGIISHHSCPSTPQQNGVAERKNHHLLDMVRTLLLESSVPPRFWCEALCTSVYLINRLPSPTLNHVSSLSCLVILLYILIFAHLVVFVLCISLLMNDINLLLSLLSVFFLVMLSLKRVMFVMTLMFVVYEFLGM